MLTRVFVVFALVVSGALGHGVVTDPKPRVVGHCFRFLRSVAHISDVAVGGRSE